MAADNFKITLTNKPHLAALVEQNPAKFKEVVDTFVWLAEEAVENEWHNLPELFSQGRVKLTFSDLVKGILHGALDLPDINPEFYPILKEEVHPLAMLVPRKDELNGGMRYFNWREWYKLDPDALVNQETVATIFRRLLRYYRFLSVDTLAQAMNNDKAQIWVQLENPNMVANLPFIPALRYQQRIQGKLHVGKFFDNVGYFDCGSWVDGNSNTCPACQHNTIEHATPYHLCQSCNAGFKEEVI